MKKNKTTSNEPKKSKDFSVLRRAVYIVSFACMLAIGAYFYIMVDTPDLTQKVLGSFAVASAINYFIQAIK